MVMLLKNGKVIGEGRNKMRHIVDSEKETSKRGYRFKLGI
jgi:hypothetical protein